jgi:hypothetical protein
MAAAHQTAVTAYRALLQAQRALFAGDIAARTAARTETRMRFMDHSGASADQVPALVQGAASAHKRTVGSSVLTTAALALGVADAHDAAIFIRSNIAQAVQNEHGNFEVQDSACHPL